MLASDDDRGATTQSASIPCPVRCSIASSGVAASPSCSAIELTAYPAVRAANSTARSVLVGPNDTAFSTSTPMRRLRCVASARAA